MGISVELSFWNLIIFGGIYYAGKKALEYYRKSVTLKKLEKWNDTPRDLLIVHGFPATKTIPNPSPFVLKVLTYLRMAKIPYTMDITEPLSPTTKKTPWITLNGQHISDSQLIIEFLNKKSEKDFNLKLTSEQKGIARAARVILEEHFFWALSSWRFISAFKDINQIFSFNWFTHFLIGRSLQPNLTKCLWYQGLGRYAPEDMYRLTADNLASVSGILGNKKFIAGDEPCEEDCAVFAQLCQVFWAIPSGSPYEKLIKSNPDMSNLREYCERMKDRYWPDWDKQVSQDEEEMNRLIYSNIWQAIAYGGG